MAAEPMMPAELFRRHTATEYDVGLWNTRSATPSLLKSPVASSVDVAAVPMTVPLESVKPLISQRLTLPFAEFCSTIASPPMLPVAIARTVDAVAATLPAAAMTGPFICQIATMYVAVFCSTMSDLPSWLQSYVPTTRCCGLAVAMFAPESITTPFIRHSAMTPVVMFCRMRSALPSPSRSPVATTFQSDDAGVATLPADAIAAPFISHAATVFVDEF